MKKTIKERPYNLLARELKARIAADRSSSILIESGITEATAKAIMAGTRPVPEKNLIELAKRTVRNNEDIDTYISFLRRLNKENASLTHLLRNGNAKLKIGYIDSPPFAMATGRGDNHPNGILIELVELFLELVGATWEWKSIPFDELISSIEKKDVDFITGFVLETPARRTRAKFIPLDMPFSIGINAVTRNEAFKSPTDYLNLRSMLEDNSLPKDERPRVITIRGELADDYYPSIFGKTEPDHREPAMTVGETIKYYLNDDEDKALNIVFADSMTCTNHAQPGAYQVLENKIGRFRGGFLFPLFDQQWFDYFSEAFYGFLRSRLPGVGRIFNRSARKLESFLEVADIGSSHGSKLNEGSHISLPNKGDFWTLEPWLEAFWPSDLMPPPVDFARKLSSEKNK